MGSVLRRRAGSDLRRRQPGHLPPLHPAGHGPDPGRLGPGGGRRDRGRARRSAKKLEHKDGYHASSATSTDAPTGPHRCLRPDPRPGVGPPDRRGRELQVGQAAGHAPGQRDDGRRWARRRRRASASSCRSTPAPKASVQILGPDLDLDATQTALLTGGSVARAVGTFSYTANRRRHASTPTRRWVAANIRTEEMPIIGRVTGNRVMLPQLRGGVERGGRAEGCRKSIYQYDGCYVPRFIARDPSKGCPSTPSAPPSTSTGRQPARHRRQDGPPAWSRSSSSGASPGAATGTTPTPCTSSWRQALGQAPQVADAVLLRHRLASSPCAQSG